MALSSVDVWWWISAGVLSVCLHLLLKLLTGKDKKSRSAPKPHASPAPSYKAAAPAPEAVTAEPDNDIFTQIKLKGVGGAVGLLLSRGFDESTKGLSVLTFDPSGFVRARLVVTTGLCNPYGALHGGAIATLIDQVSTLSIVAATGNIIKAGVSVDLNVSYTSSAKCGEALLIEAHALKVGNRIAFTQCDIITEKDRALIASGRHTKCI
jgi:acyl-coenzyme A thioesterase 13